MPNVNANRLTLLISLLHSLKRPIPVDVQTIAVNQGVTGIDSLGERDNNFGYTKDVVEDMSATILEQMGFSPEAITDIVGTCLTNTATVSDGTIESAEGSLIEDLDEEASHEDEGEGFVHDDEG